MTSRWPVLTWQVVVWVTCCVACGSNAQKIGRTSQVGEVDAALPRETCSSEPKVLDVELGRQIWSVSNGESLFVGDYAGIARIDRDALKALTKHALGSQQRIQGVHATEKWL